MATLGKIAILKKYFENGFHGRKLELGELKVLTPDERTELAKQAATELGDTISPITFPKGS